VELPPTVEVPFTSSILTGVSAPIDPRLPPLEIRVVSPAGDGSKHERVVRPETESDGFKGTSVLSPLSYSRIPLRALRHPFLEAPPFPSSPHRRVHIEPTSVSRALCHVEWNSLPRRLRTFCRPVYHVGLRAPLQCPPSPQRCADGPPVPFFQEVWCARTATEGINRSRARGHRPRPWVAFGYRQLS